jgi:carboxypeptidase C (cathepsin A)
MVDAFLAQPAVISALGVAGLTWQDCSHAVNIELVFAGDWMRNLAQVVPNILASGVRVIAYSGEYDFICNWYGGNAWTNALVWPGQQAFQTAQNTTWLYNGEEAGSSRTADGFTFVRVKDAGHMVPLNQPERALDLLARVINGQPFDGTPAAAQAETPVAKENPAIALE